MSQSIYNNPKIKRFSIDDAFEEETDEAIKVYANSPSSSATSVVNCSSNNNNNNNNNTSTSGATTDTTNQQLKNGSYKIVNDTSRDSDSLIQDYYEDFNQDYYNYSCFKHPKVRENWRMVLAAVTLLIIGIGLLTTATISLAKPNSALQGSVFLLAGFICFVPGAYHVVYIYFAAKGRRGYHFHNLPLFT